MDERASVDLNNLLLCLSRIMSGIKQVELVINGT